MEKNPSQQQISQFTAALASGITLLFLMVTVLLTGIEFPLWLYPLILIVVFSSVFFTMRYMVERFIYRKIKLIYKSIHSIKTGKDVLRDRIDSSEYVLDEVEHEVKEYTASKTLEINKLKEMEQFRREFLGDVSHELKTPIFNIQGYLDTLISGGLNDKRIADDYLLKANQNVDRLSTIVEDLLLINRYESGKLKLDLDTFIIQDLGREVLDSFEMQADIKDSKLEIKQGTETALWVEADKKMITQVLSNLVSNAIKYGKEKGYVSLGFYDMEEHILIEVSDNGQGIEEEHLPRLFDRFYRIDKHRSRGEGGTGLGLSITKHIVETHGQSISVRSKPDLGTTFGFTLNKAKPKK